MWFNVFLDQNYILKIIHEIWKKIIYLRWLLHRSCSAFVCGDIGDKAFVFIWICDFEILMIQEQFLFLVEWWILAAGVFIRWYMVLDLALFWGSLIDSNHFLCAICSLVIRCINVMFHSGLRNLLSVSGYHNVGVAIIIQKNKLQILDIILLVWFFTFSFSSWFMWNLCGLVKHESRSNFA